MTSCSRHLILALSATFGFAAPMAAQDIALKGGLAISRFESTGAMPFDGSFRSTSFGGHVRWYFGPIAIQPEVQIVSRGASIENPPEGTEERIRLDYMEIPLMLVLPVQIGDFRPYAFGGPMLSLETRCRSIVEEEGLTTNFGCDDASAEQNTFDRRAVDWGVSAGAGVSHRIGSGRILLEGRHTWGLRDIYDGAGEDIEVRNRSMVFMIGYVIPAGILSDDR